jgi:hypothetical protein
VRRVLIAARKKYQAGAQSMLDCIDEAANGGAEGWYAKQELRRFLLQLNLPDWERHPSRLREEVHALFRRVIGRLTPHRGGWQVAR